MDGNGFDPCECIWSHNMAMRRLLSLLRQSQAYCTDNECFNELPGSNITTSEENFFFIAIFWLFFTIVLYFLRPSTFRRIGEDTLKLRNNDNDSSDNSSAPPPSIASSTLNSEEHIEAVKRGSIAVDNFGDCY